MRLRSAVGVHGETRRWMRDSGEETQGLPRQKQENPRLTVYCLLIAMKYEWDFLGWSCVRVCDVRWATVLLGVVVLVCSLGVSDLEEQLRLAVSAAGRGWQSQWLDEVGSLKG